MPIYEYYCQSCEKTHEIIQKMNDPVLTQCTACNGKLEKLISSTSFQLKGEGWYVTDFKDPKKSEKKEATTDDKSTSDTPSTSTENKSTSTTDNKPSSKSDKSE